MKSAFAYALILITSCAGLAGAETAQAGEMNCPNSGAATDLAADCQADRSAFRVKITDCMARRAAEAEALIAGKATKSSHATRARYLLCAAEVNGTSALVFP